MLFRSNFNLNINTSDILFDSLKTIPITKKADDAVTNKLVTFFNTPAFITIAILLAILLPCAALYNIFFISNTDKVPMAPQTEIVTVTNEPVTLQLEEFDVKQNIITSISINILNNIAGNNIDAASLKILSANDNSITDITGITAFKNIEELYLSSNKITDIDALVEINDSLSIGAAIENMILTATGYGLGTLWIANTCFAYNELMDFIGTDSQLTGIVAVGFADEAPAKRPRKPLEEIVEYR